MLLKKLYIIKLVVKINSIDTSGFILKTKYDTDKSKIENKIPNTNDLAKKADYNTKITEIESKIPDVCSLVTKTALNTVENKMLDVSSLVEKTDYNTKITEIEKKLTNHNHDKYITTPEFNTLAADVFNARLARVNLVTKTDFDNSAQVLIVKSQQIKRKMSLLKTNLKSLKYLIQALSEVKVTLKNMVHKII